MPFLAEEVFASYSQQSQQSQQGQQSQQNQQSQQSQHSVFEEGYMEVPAEWRDAGVVQQWRGWRTGQ